ncbi:hypothetical protein PG994_002388 [Apiospora phragmitis]|uniref:Uncharacterized protein n=1 Tax=Apiospora phragmitis TaxID=2905665 RepID=A0ABR1WW86_9PEZI
MSSNSTPSETSIELAARSFDLLSAIVKSSQTSSAIVRSTQELVKWLASECVQESIFTQCAELARSLAYPNEDALVVRASIAEADKKLHTLRAPLRLINSGSLGRLIAQDPEFSYMVTTVTSLSNFYKIDRITDTVCSMMFYHNGNPASAQYQYQVQRAPIRAVTLKIVESISRNVVNAGHSLQGIPEELSRLHVHLVDPSTFAALVRGIREATNDIVLRCDRFIGDITMWLLNHFHGTFEVVLRSQLVLKRQLGSEKQTVRFFVTNECADHKSCYLQECTVRGIRLYRIWLAYNLPPCCHERWHARNTTDAPSPSISVSREYVLVFASITSECNAQSGAEAPRPDDRKEDHELAFKTPCRGGTGIKFPTNIQG